MMRTLTDRLGWKLLSVVIAFVLWASYSVESELGTSIAVPLQYRNLPQNLELSGDIGVDRIYLKIRGPAASLSPSSLANTAILLDIGGVDRSGERTYTLGPSNVHLPAGVQLVRIIPSQVRLKFEQRITRELPVEARYTSGVPSGYRIVSEEIVPSTLSVIGPESRVRRLASAATDAIDLSTTYGEAEFRVPVFLADPYVRLERDTTIVVRVKLEKSSAK